MQQPRIAAWSAVSSEEQGKGFSLEYQATKNREHAALHNGLIVAEISVEESRSIVLWEDACRRIPAYAQLNELIQRKAIDILMCMDATRLGRDRALIITLASLCERAGIRIYETSSPPASIEGPHSTSDTRLLLMLKGHISEEEIRKFGERSRFGRRARIKKGKHPGPPMYGYERHFDENGIAYLVVNEEQAKVVKLFYDLVLNHGRSMKSVCDELNARGILTPRAKKKWIVGTIRIFALNCWAYAGYTTWGKKYSKIAPEEQFRVKGEWEPLISEDDARRMIAILQARSHAPRSVSTPYRFSMVAVCGYCGSTVTVHARAGGSTCATNRYLCVKRCRGSRVGEPELMKFIHEFLESLQDENVLESFIDETPDRHTELARQLDEANAECQKVVEQRKRLTLAFTTQTITFDEFENLMSELQARRDNWARRVAELEDLIAQTPSATRRRQRLIEARDNGLEKLYHPDPQTANAWLRERLRVIVAAYQPKICQFSDLG